MPENRRTFFFIHIPKTGGQSLRDHFIKHLELHRTFIHHGPMGINDAQAKGLTRWTERPADERQQARVVLGHNVNSRTPELVPFCQPEWVVLLRDPAEQAVSNYNFKMEARRLAGQSVIPFTDWYPTQPRNFQIHYLLYSFMGLLRPLNDDQERLQIAEDVLSRIHWVLDTKRLDQDAQGLLQTIGVPTQMQRTNQTGTHFPRLLSMDENLRQRLNDDNPLDKWLYDKWCANRRNPPTEPRPVTQAITGLDAKDAQDPFSAHQRQPLAPKDPNVDLRVIALPGTDMAQINQAWAPWIRQYCPEARIQFITDPELKVTPSETPALVILRYPLDQFVVWFNERCAEQPGLDQPKQWMHHALNLPGIWQQFFKTWFLNQPPYARVIDYDQLHTDNSKVTQCLAEILLPESMNGNGFDEPVLSPVAERFAWEHFRYFGPAFAVNIKNAFAGCPWVDADDDVLRLDLPIPTRKAINNPPSSQKDLSRFEGSPTVVFPAGKVGSKIIHR